MAQKVISTAILIAIMCQFSGQSPVPKLNELIELNQLLLANGPIKNGIQNIIKPILD